MAKVLRKRRSKAEVAADLAAVAADLAAAIPLVPFTLIFPFDVAPLVYPEKSTGKIDEIVVLRIKAANHAAAVQLAMKDFGKSLYFIAMFTGHPGVVRGRIVESFADLKEQFPPYTGPQPR